MRAVPSRFHSPLFALLCLCMLALAARANDARQVTITRSETTGASTARPWLVQLVFDQSGSMQARCDEDPLAKGRPRWTVVVEDAQKKVEQLQRALGAYDLRIYTFGSKAAKYGAPFEERSFTVASESDAKEVADELVRLPEPRRGESTNLWNSLSDLSSGAASDPASRNYSGLLTIVFSDGLDYLGGADQSNGGEPL